jgi:hypothetical protein
MRLLPLLAALLMAAGCHANNGTGTTGTGGGASGGTSGTGGATGSGGTSGTGGATGSGGQSAAGGSTGSGGTTGTGGAATGGRGGGSAGGSTGTGGGTGTGGAGTAGAGSYALNPPRQCDNQFFVQGCQKGMASSTCGGVCAAANACEDISQKPGADVGFLCPRFALASSEMAQAAVDDFGASPPFNYAIVGHDVDQNGLDGSARSACCQCYQLVYDLPENEAQVQGGGASAIAIPKPLIVQAFNTSAGGGQNFDVFMGAGGFGSFNACDPNFTAMKSPSGLYLYSTFPEQGEPGSGGVNAATQLAGCKDNNNLVTTATLSSSTCVANVESACSMFASSTLTSTAVNDSIQSCKASNDPASYTHINWQVYAKKIECPTHLAQVTGCKLAPQGLPAANPNVTTPAQAAADSSFKATAGNGSHYTTTTMQDCCKPTCAWQDWVTGQNGGLTAVGQYNSFYSCDQSGVPVTE